MVAVQSFVINVSVCLSVCLFVCMSAPISQNPQFPNFTKFSVHVTCSRGSVLQCDTLCTSGFVYEVMFPYNGGNNPESKTMRMFRPVRQVVAPVGRQTTLFGRDRQVAAPGARSVVSDCILSTCDCFGGGLQWRLATMVTMNTNECQNIANSIVNNFEECGITLLQTKMLMQSDIDYHTIERRLDEIKMQSRSKQYTTTDDRFNSANY